MGTTIRRFLTLTIRPIPGATPADELAIMNHAWNLLWKRIQRRHGNAAKGYVKIIEVTQRGHPHLHIGLDTPFISQRQLSQHWADLVGSPVVDIRRIHTQRGVARYLAKYLSKQDGRIPGHRRYSSSNGFLPPFRREEPEEGEIPPSWRYSPTEFAELIRGLTASGYVRVGNFFVEPGRLSISQRERLQTPTLARQ
jgi:hypothetical protein